MSKSNEYIVRYRVAEGADNGLFNDIAVFTVTEPGWQNNALKLHEANILFNEVAGTTHKFVVLALQYPGADPAIKLTSLDWAAVQ